MRIWWRALLPALAVLVPAVALAVLGIRSYQAEQILAESRFRNSLRSIAELTATVLEDSTHAALREIVDLARSGVPSDLAMERVRARHPLVGRVFVLDAAGRFRYPRVSESEGVRADPGPRPLLLPIGPPGLPDRGRRLYRLVATYHARLRRELLARQMLGRARAAEVGGAPWKALRRYRRVAERSATLAPEAWHGIARTAARLGRWAEAAAAYRVMLQRVPTHRDWAGVPYAVLARLGLLQVAERCAAAGAAPGHGTGASGVRKPDSRGSSARGRPPRCPEGLGLPGDVAMRLYADLARGPMGLGTSLRLFYLDWVRRKIPSAAGSERRRRLEELDASVRLLVRGIAFARRLGAPAARQVAKLAQYRPRAIRVRGLGQRDALLVVRRVGDAVVGFVLRTPALEAQLARPELLRRLPEGYRLALERLPTGAPRTPRADGAPLLRRPLDRALGDLALAIYGPRGEAGTWFSRGALEYLALVGGLVLVLIAGLVTVWRGVRHEMELARLKSEFVSNVSHELKTPLTSIRMFSEMLEADLQPDPEQRKTYYRVMVTESDRLARLIGNVLDFSRLERGTRSYERERVALSDLAREAVARFSHFREAEGREVTLTVDRDVQVDVERDAVVESILNLLVNAAKYSSEGAPIRVRVYREPAQGGRATGRAEGVVAVIDQGIGIPRGEQRRIFEDFYRASNAPAGREGTGLGLALVRRHCEGLGGRVEVESRLGEGSTFLLRFPEVSA